MQKDNWFLRYSFSWQDSQVGLAMSMARAVFYSKQAPFLPICCLNCCCFCSTVTDFPGAWQGLSLGRQQANVTAISRQDSFNPWHPSHGCLLLNELLLSTQLNGVVRNWKLSLLQLLLWQDFFSSLLPLTVSGTHAVLQIRLRPALNRKCCKHRSWIQASASRFSFFQGLDHGQLD